MRSNGSPASTIADIPLHIISDAMGDRSARGIAAALHRLITDGRIRPGQRLPTVRSIGESIGVSPSTVNQAWQALVKSGVLQSRGRAGTFVANHNKPEALRYLSLSRTLSDSGIDLSRGTPDSELLPSLADALERVSGNRDIWTSTYFEEPVIAELDELLRESWPFVIDGLTVVDGALDALSRVIDQTVSFGDRVVMESPGFPPLIDLLEQVGAEILPVQLDGHGLVVEELQQSLMLNPTAVFIQPRAHNPTGTSMSRLRASEIAAALADSDCLVIEDDHSGDISLSPDVSIGQFLPNRIIHIRSYSKSHGPDLRLAAIGGRADIVEKIVTRRMLGPGWSSRLLQHVLVDLLTHEESRSAVELARDTYAHRSRHLRESLLDSGIFTTPGDGINVFVPVPDEQSTIVNLAADGMRVAPGRPFYASNNQPPHIRVTTAALPNDENAIKEYAEKIYRASLVQSRSHALR